MANTQVQCPHCQGVLTTSLQLRVGTQMQCGKCRNPFTITGANLLSAAAEPKPTPPVATCPSASQAAETLPVPRPVPNCPPAGILVADSRPLPAATPAYPSLADQTSSQGQGRPLLALAGLALFLLLGMGLTIWGLQETPPGQPDQGQPAQNAQLAQEAGANLLALPAKENLPTLPQPPAPAQVQNPAPLPTPAPEPIKEAPQKPAEEPMPAKAAASDPPPPPPPPAISEEQKRINAAIERGTAFLKTCQQPHGSWAVNNAHVVGYAALPGLTLLECQVPPDDPVVQKAAAFVRMYSPNLNQTYELSLALLFLDRLGDPRDRALIQSLALRLIAGQNFSGGWTYSCPILNVQQMQTLFGILQKERLDAPLPPAPNPLGQNPLLLGQAVLPVPIAKAGSSAPVPDDKKEGEKPVGKTPPRTKSKVQPQGSQRPNFLVVSQLQNLPAVFNLGKGKGKMALRGGFPDDNSNTQFALLALWAARRHDVPSTPSLLLADQRFALTQNPNGGWGYNVGHGSQPAMTCVGLMGLAMGHGSAAAPEAGAKVGKKAVEDPHIQKGLQALGTFIGLLPPGNTSPPMENLYFMWSLERVAMLYNLDTIGSKDWYAWGVRILLPNQMANGTWQSAPYHGSTPTLDTCFALLFLKRSNLVRNRSDNLRLWIAIRDPALQAPPEKNK